MIKFLYQKNTCKYGLIFGQSFFLICVCALFIGMDGVGLVTQSGTLSP
jgi:hypothetical protein